MSRARIGSAPLGKPSLLISPALISESDSGLRVGYQFNAVSMPVPASASESVLMLVLVLTPESVPG